MVRLRRSRGRTSAGVRPWVDDVGEPEALQPLGADGLLAARDATGHQDRTLPRRERFQGGVVAGHAQDRTRAREPLAARVQGTDDARSIGAQLPKSGHRIGAGVGTGRKEADQVGATREQLRAHVEDGGSVATATGGDDEQVAVRTARPGLFHHPAAVGERQGEPVLRLVVDEAWVTVDQDLVVDLLDVRPAESSHLLADDRRLVEDVPQAEHQRGPASPRHLEAGAELAGRSVGVPVHDHDVGPLVLDEHLEDALALPEGVLEGKLLVAVGPVRRLQHLRDAVHADALSLPQPPRADLEPRDQADLRRRVGVEHRASDQAVAANVTETVSVVRVEQITGSHVRHLSLLLHRPR